MSLQATMTQLAHVYERAAGQEHWRRVTVEPIACSIVPLSPREAEMAAANLRAHATHRARCLPRAEIAAGRKLVLVGPGPACFLPHAAPSRERKQRAFIIVHVRRFPRPHPDGHLCLYLEELDQPSQPGAKP